MKRWQWLIALSPAVLGLILAAFVIGGRVANPAFYLRIEADPLVALTGLVLSTGLAIVLAVLGRVQRIRHKTLKESMIQATEARHRFLRRLDHELKNPLTAVRADLANLAVTGGPEEHVKALTRLQAQVSHLSRLVASLRKLADLETRALERLPASVGEVVETTFRVAQEQPAAQERRLTLSLPHRPLIAPVDRDLLSLVIYNLLDNALKFTRPGDAVELRVLENGHVIVIEVADSGPGIAEADMPYVWEELYRGHGARGVPGSGIGLPLVRTIVERHGGHVRLRSQPGQGSLFTIQLPKD